MSHLLHRVLLIRIDADKLHAIRLIFFGDFGESAAIKLGQRTLGTQEGDHDQLFVLPIAKLVFRALNIDEREIGDRRLGRRQPRTR